MTEPTTEPRSPMGGPTDNGEYTTRRTTVAELEIGLAGVLSRLVLDPGKWILIVELGPTPSQVRGGDCSPDSCLRGYVQWLVYPDGSFVTEVSSSRSLDPAHALTPAQEARLDELGWLAPLAVPGAPNFHRVCADPTEIVMSADWALTAMTQVLDAQPREVALVKMMMSQRRDVLSPREEASRPKDRPRRAKKLLVLECPPRSIGEMDEDELSAYAEALAEKMEPALLADRQADPS